MGTFINTALKDLGFTIPHLRAESHQTNGGADPAAKTVIASAGTPVKLVGIFATDISQGCTLNANGTITVTAEATDSPVMFNGSANGRTNKACKVTFILYLNGAAVDYRISPVKFNNAGDNKNFAIASGALISKDDYLDVYVESDTDNTEFILDSFNSTIWGR